jgi:polyisoprenoid-binding protein YceI
LICSSSTAENIVRFPVILLASALVTPGSAPIQEFRIDAGHSDVAFSIGFLGHPVRGRFDDIRGLIAYAPNDPSASAVSVVIGVKSIATGSTHRDDHLRSADFFDAAKYPLIAFRSASIVRRGDALMVTGPLSMHGVTRTVTIPFRETTPLVADPHGSNLIFFSGALRIARKDYQIMGGSNYNDWFDELRSATMGDSVDINLDISGWTPDPLRTTKYDATIKRIETNGVGALVAHVRALRLDSLNGDLYDIEQLTRVLQSRGKSSAAIAILEAVVEKLDGSATAHAALARTYEIAGNDSLARRHAARALSLDSLDARSLELARRLGIRGVR